MSGDQFGLALTAGPALGSGPFETTSLAIAKTATVSQFAYQTCGMDVIKVEDLTKVVGGNGPWTGNCSFPQKTSLWMSCSDVDIQEDSGCTVDASGTDLFPSYCH